MSNGMGSHHRPLRGAKDEWITPPSVLSALGPFDLDPCAAVSQPWPTATRHLTINDDGLSAAWEDEEFVWLNPPYGPSTWPWLNRLACHPAGGLALIFARTETAGFFGSCWGKADAMLFLKGRLHFYHADGTRGSGNSGAPSVLVAYGATAVERLQATNLRGVFVDTWKGAR